MEGSDQQYRPIPLSGRKPDGTPADWWIIDGKAYLRGGNVGEETSLESREMHDLDARLRHMDELGVDVQVLFPSIFLRPLTERPAVDTALARGYNRWLGGICTKSQGRLRWAIVPPVLDLDAAMAELHWGKEHDACAVFIRGVEPGHRLNDPYFFPLYAEASRLNIPICVHSGSNSYQLHDFYENESGFNKFKLVNIGAFHSLVYDDIPAKFPELRWGFIELSAQWVPYVIHDLAKRFEKKGRRLQADLLRENRMYVACQVDDDLPYVLSYAGEDNLVIGSDYGHADTATEIEALRRLKEQGEVSPGVINKILDDNARALYAL
jgi:predicted TIM-barrel fold metal-dependent hydrolase